MTRREFVALRLGVWAGRGEYAAGALAERDAQAAEAAGVKWDPETEEPELPTKVWLHNPASGPLELRGTFGQEQKVIATIFPATLDLTLLRAFVAAYNREREMDEVEADVDDATSAGLAALCREEIDAEVEAGVARERARCVAILRDLEVTDESTPREFRHFLHHERPRRAVLPFTDWNEALTTARRKVESGETPDGGKRCALCGKEWPHGHTPEQVAEWRARGGAVGTPEPSREFPERLVVVPRFVSFSDHCAIATAPTAEAGRWRYLTPEEAEEAARRWEAEPVLRERISAAIDLATGMRSTWDPSARAWMQFMRLVRILTGKEES
jgi:hypothetical protein